MPTTPQSDYFRDLRTDGLRAAGFAAGLRAAGLRAFVVGGFGPRRALIQPWPSVSASGMSLFRAAGFFFCAGGERFRVAWGGATLVPPRERRIGTAMISDAAATIFHVTLFKLLAWRPCKCSVLRHVNCIKMLQVNITPHPPKLLP